MRSFVRSLRIKERANERNELPMGMGPKRRGERGVRVGSVGQDAMHTNSNGSPDRGHVRVRCSLPLAVEINVRQQYIILIRYS